MGELTTAQLTLRVNVAVIVICSIFLVICLWRQLWIPAAFNAVLIVSNTVQLAQRRRPS